MTAYLRDPALAACAGRHGFGVRGCPPVRGVVRPRQVHGRAVACARAGRATPEEADAIVSTDPDQPVGVVTADCVPILLATTAGGAVAAVHAGWRGLAAGVVAAGVAALRRADPGEEIRAAIGPHVGRCCYEVDEPVVRALGARFGADLESALSPARPDHWRLDLGALVGLDLERSDVGRATHGTAAAACTACDPERFHSYRRDGPRAGRLLHFIAPRRGVDTRLASA